MFRVGRRLLGAAVLCLSLDAGASRASAQAFQGTVQGVVKDPSGAVVPGAIVHAIDEDKRTDVTTKTNSRGEYEFASLLPSAYTLQVSKDGFSTAQMNKVTVEVNQTLRLDFNLTLGTAEQTVTISTSYNNLETEDASLGQVVTMQEIEELPLVIRDPFSLIALTPGVVLGPTFGAGGAPDVGRNFAKNNFNVGGGRSGSQAFLIDGAPDTTGDSSKPLIDPPVDAVQEFKVQAISYDAQFGRTSGATINILTRSGSNSVHGAVYDFERNSAFNASNYFAVGNTTNYSVSQAGGVVGFPILKDRWFGFADFEALIQAVPETFRDTVPTAMQRGGDFSATTYTSTKNNVTTTVPVNIYDPATLSTVTNFRSQFMGCGGTTPNVICSNRISALGQSIVNRFPLPNATGDANNANNFIYTANQTTNSYKYDIRNDFNLKGKTTMFARFSRQNDHRVVPGTLPPANSGGLTNDIYTQAVIGLTRVLTANMLVSATTSFVRGNAIQVGSLPPVDLQAAGFSANFASQAAPQLPELITTDVTDLQLKSNVNQQHQPRNTYSTSAALHYLHGHHSLKLGGEWWILGFNEYQNAASSSMLQFDHFYTQQKWQGSSLKNSGADVADILLGYPSGINPNSLSEGSFIDKVQAISTRGLYYAAFLQDDWRVSDRLTLNVGLRWDVSIGDREKYNRLAWFDPNAPSPLGPSVGMPGLQGLVDWVGHGNDRDQQQTSWTNMNPRLGFAYQMKHFAVVRGGYGIYFLPRSVQGNGVGGLESNVETEMPVMGPMPQFTLSDPFANGVMLPNNDRSPIAGVGSTISVPTHDFKAAYVQLFSFGFQQKLPWGILSDIHYWGNLGTHIPTTAALNALPNKYLDACNAAGNCSTTLTAKVVNPFYGVVSGQQPTTTQQQLDLPFPQYAGAGGVSQQLVPVGHTSYNALTVQAQKRVSRVLSFTAQYTWGKSMDDLGTPVNYADRGAEYALSTLDVTNQFIGSFVGQIPYGRKRRFGASAGRLKNAFLGEWNINGIVSLQSGLPVQISRPSFLAAGSVPRIAHPTPNMWFNTGGITDAIYSYGNIGPDLSGVRTDPTRNLNVVFAKNFSSRWRQHEFVTQLRAESFNALNHPQFAAPNGTITSVAFGTVTSQQNQPRQFQFGAKLKF